MIRGPPDPSCELYKTRGKDEVELDSVYIGYGIYTIFGVFGVNQEVLGPHPKTCCQSPNLSFRLDFWRTPVVR